MMEIINALRHTDDVLSIIIATHQRHDTLTQCLHYIAKQTIVGELEVIVVSDGEDPFINTLRETHWPFALLTSFVPKSQQGVARNAGVKMATSDYCLFINDDIFLLPNACELHIAALQKLNQIQPTAVLGFTTWDPKLTINSTMKFLESSGWQFGYPALKKYKQDYIPASMQHKFTYSSHCSMPLQIAKENSFLTNVQLYGWEDIEWGQRLQTASVGLWYQSNAIAWHHHAISPAQSLKRMYTIGKSAVIMSTLNPELKIVPKGIKYVYYVAMSLLPTKNGQHKKAFLAGVNSAKQSTTH